MTFMWWRLWTHTNKPSEKHTRWGRRQCRIMRIMSPPSFFILLLLLQVPDCVVYGSSWICCDAWCRSIRMEINHSRTGYDHEIDLLQLFDWWQTNDMLEADFCLVPLFGHSLPLSWASIARTAGLISGTPLELSKWWIGDRCDRCLAIYHASITPSILLIFNKTMSNNKKVIDSGEKTKNFPARVRA